MDNYKATPEQWAGIERYGKVSNYVVDACILELRARVEALEAQANHFVDVPKMVPPTVATDEELDDTWHQAGNAPGGTFVACRRAIYNLGIEHGQACRPKPPSLKEQALEILRKHADRAYLTDESSADANIIRRALEQLND